MPGVLLCCLVHQAPRGPTLGGVLLCRSGHQSLKGAPWVGSCSVVQCLGCLMGQTLYVQLLVLACGAREAMVMASPLTCDSAVSPCFHGCPAFFYGHFPSVSSLTSPRSVSLQSTETLALGSLHNPKTPVPSCCAFLGTLLGVCMAAARTI